MASTTNNTFSTLRRLEKEQEEEDRQVWIIWSDGDRLEIKTKVQGWYEKLVNAQFVKDTRSRLVQVREQWTILMQYTHKNL